jgi:hypothetical protein
MCVVCMFVCTKRFFHKFITRNRAKIIMPVKLYNDQSLLQVLIEIEENLTSPKNTEH